MIRIRIPIGTQTNPSISNQLLLAKCMKVTPARTNATAVLRYVKESSFNSKQGYVYC